MKDSPENDSLGIDHTGKDGLDDGGPRQDGFLNNNLGRGSPGEGDHVGDDAGDTHGNESPGEGSSEVEEGEGAAGESSGNLEIDHTDDRDSESERDDAPDLSQDHICLEKESDDVNERDNIHDGVPGVRWTPKFLPQSRPECYTVT